MNNLLDISINQYEGPLDLLIHLIHKNEMNIFDVSISAITDHFVAEIRLMKSLNMEITAEFIYMASYLIYLKSRSLLPSGELSEGELPIEEEMFNLDQIILELAYCKDLAEKLRKLHENNKKYFTRSDGLKLPGEDRTGNPFSLTGMYFGILNKEAEMKVEISSTKEHADNVVEKTQNILTSKESTLWSELNVIFNEGFERAIAFSTVLTLSKQQVIRSIQESNFTEILMKRLTEQGKAINE